MDIEDHIYRLMASRGIAVITVGHRPSLKVFYICCSNRLSPSLLSLPPPATLWTSAGSSRYSTSVGCIGFWIRNNTTPVTKIEREGKTAHSVQLNHPLCINRPRRCRRFSVYHTLTPPVARVKSFTEPPLSLCKRACGKGNDRR